MQFSLRTLLIVMLVGGPALAVVWWWFHADTPETFVKLSCVAIAMFYAFVFFTAKPPN